MDSQELNSLDSSESSIILGKDLQKNKKKYNDKINNCDKRLEDYNFKLKL